MSVRADINEAIDAALSQQRGQTSLFDSAAPDRGEREQHHLRAAFAERLRRFLDAAPAWLDRDALRGALEGL